MTITANVVRNRAITQGKRGRIRSGVVRFVEEHGGEVAQTREEEEGYCGTVGVLAVLVRRAVSRDEHDPKQGENQVHCGAEPELDEDGLDN
jgi:hypothetical protein